MNCDTWNGNESTPTKILDFLNKKYKVKIITALTIENKDDVEEYKKFESISEIILFDSKGYEKSVGFDHQLLNNVPAKVNKMLAVSTIKGGIKVGNKKSKS